MDRLERAMQTIKRVDFVPPSERDQAVFDIPIEIGYGQTNSQPTTVRRMLGWLDAQPGDPVLDVGSGSGWTTALLAKIVGRKGFVHAVEYVPQLITMGRDNCAKYHLQNVAFYQAGEQYGLPAHAPYDRILVSASAFSVPPDLIAQLKHGGRMVIPVGDTIYVIDKQPDGTLTYREHPGYLFVPLMKY